MISKLTLVALMSLVVVAMSQNNTTVSVPPLPVNATEPIDKESEVKPSVETSKGPEAHPAPVSRETTPEDDTSSNDQLETTPPAEAPKQENSHDLARLAYGALGLFFVNLL